MKDWKSLSHVRWEYKYHLVFISKYRHRTIYGEVRKKIGGIVRSLCRQKGIELHEGHAMPDHIHLLLSIPPKFSVSNTFGFIKGKSAIRISEKASYPQYSRIRAVDFCAVIKSRYKSSSETVVSIDRCSWGPFQLFSQ